MPAPKKLNLVPAEIVQWLKDAAQERGFGDIIQLTEDLNFRLEEEGLELRIGKTAVGAFTKALKDQQDALSLAETLLADMDIEEESNLHKVLMQMIATAAVQLIRSVREEDGYLPAKDLMALGRMLKDLMASAGIREKLLDDERERVAREAREAERAEVAGRMDTAAKEAGLSEDQASFFRRKVLGLREPEKKEEA